MKNQKFLKIAGVLLLSALMLVPASAAVANTNAKKAAVSLQGGENIISGTATSGARDVLYDNGLPDGVNGVSCEYWSAYPLDRMVIDDFTNTETWEVTGGQYRILVSMVVEPQ